MDVRRLFSLSCPLAQKQCLLRENLQRRVAAIFAETSPGYRPKTVHRRISQDPSIHDHCRQRSRAIQPSSRHSDSSQIESRISYLERHHGGTYRALNSYGTLDRSVPMIHHRPRSKRDRLNLSMMQGSSSSIAPPHLFSQYRCHHQLCRAVHQYPTPTSNASAEPLATSGVRSFSNSVRRQRAITRALPFSRTGSVAYHSSAPLHLPFGKTPSSATRPPPTAQVPQSNPVQTPNPFSLNPNAPKSPIFGRRKRRMAALYRFRQRRQMMFQQRSVPQHTSRLQQMGDDLRRPRPAGVSASDRRKRVMLKRRKKRRAFSQLIQSEAHMPLHQSPRPPGSLPPLPPAPTAQYLHVHYYHPRRYPKRTRLEGFQHFLKLQRVKSWHGRQAYRMEKARVKQLLWKKASNLKYSLNREIVKEHRNTLQELQINLSKGKKKKAIRCARWLISLRPQGVKLPGGSQFAQLATVDQVFYERFVRSDATSKTTDSTTTDPMNQETSATASSTPAHEIRPVSRRKKKKSYFTTLDYNVMLTHCEELQDWGNGYKIACFLMDRYRSPTYDFQSGNHRATVPNAKTIHLLSTVFCKSNHPELAMELLSIIIHGKGSRPYPQTIPEDICSAFLSHLATLPNQIPRMKELMRDLETYGPKPTTTMYNMLLRATGFQMNVESAEDMLPMMRSKGCMPNQQTFQTLISISLKDLDLHRAYFWLDQIEAQGNSIRSRMLDPFMSTCIQQVVSTLNRAHLNRSNSASQASSTTLGEYPLPNVRSKKKSATSATISAEDLAYSQEWMNNALQVIQLTKSKGLTPTLDMHEQLIEGLLAQDNLREARKMLHMMRDVYFQPITQRVWIRFFDYHLWKFDHESAMKILNEMRTSAKLRPSINEYLNVPRPEAVPTKLYHRLFRHLLDHGRLSNAERSLYEMLVRQRRARPSEKEVVDLIWKLERHPFAAERVYELLYPQTVAERVAAPDAASPMERKDRIVEQGPIQMANVGVMHAKALTKDLSLQEDVWKDWGLMTHRFVTSTQQDKDSSTTATLNDEEVLSPAISREAQVEKDKAVIALAFEQVAVATRNMSPGSKQAQGSRQKDRGATGGDSKKEVLQKRDPGPWDFLRTSSSDRNRTQEAPKFGFISLGLGRRGGHEETSESRMSGFGFGRDFISGSRSDEGLNTNSDMSNSTEGSRRSLMAGMTPAMHLAFTGKNRQTIQQLLRRNEFLQPLLDRRASSSDTTDDASSPLSSQLVQETSSAKKSVKAGLSSASMLDPMGTMTDRLERLKKSFEWLEDNRIPIRTSTLNAYLHGLVSYGDHDVVRATVQKYVLVTKEHPAQERVTLMPQSSLPSSLRGVEADLRTLRILNKWVSFLDSSDSAATTTVSSRGSDASRHLNGNRTASPTWNERKGRSDQDLKRHRDALSLLERVVRQADPELQKSWKDRQATAATDRSITN